MEQRFRLIQGDCLVEMAKLPDQMFHAIIVDLPFGTTSCSWDVIIPLAPLWEQFKRLIKPNGAVVLFGSQPFTTLLIASNLEWFKYCWVWEKLTPVDVFNCKNKPMKKHEDICVFSQGTVANGSSNRMNYYPQGLIKTSVKKTNRSVGGKVYGARPSRCNGSSYIQEFTNYPHSILSFAEPTDNLHPTQKPDALLDYLVQTYTNPGDTVLDCCFGSGTTGVACMETGRKFVGIERDEHYFDVGLKRIADAARAAQGLPKQLRGKAADIADMPLFAAIGD